MARPSNTGRRREQIVDGLLTVMERRGFDGASVVEIGRAAGLAPGLVHYHFKDKQEILVALIERLVRSARSRFEAIGPEKGPRERVHALIDAWLGLGAGADPRAVAAWNVVGTEAVRQPEVGALFRKAVAEEYAALRRQIGAWLRAEGRSATAAGWIAAAVVSAAEGSFRLAAAAPGVLPRGYAAPTLKRMLDALVARKRS